MFFTFFRFYLNRINGSINNQEVINPLLDNIDDSKDITAVDSPRSRSNSRHSRSDSIASILSIDLSHPITVQEFIRVMKLINVPALSVFFTFTVTIGVFPSLTVFIESTNKCNDINDRFSNDLFTPLLFLFFNLFDLIGRVLAGVYNSWVNVTNIKYLSLARLIFVPLFLLCNISDSKLPNVFVNDFWPFFFMTILALSNGYVSSNCMMMGPSLVDAKDASLVGTIMIFSLTFGLLAGSCVSFLVVLISQGSV